MKKYLSAVLLVLVATATFAVAQTPKAVVNADVPFAFIVSGKSLPAGSYHFAANSNFSEINVSTSAGKGSAIAMVTTRLSMRPENEASLVFDVVGTEHYLAEIYMPGMDGFQVPCAPGQHTHVSIKAKK